MRHKPIHAVTDGGCMAICCMVPIKENNTSLYVWLHKYEYVNDEVCTALYMCPLMYNIILAK